MSKQLKQIFSLFVSVVMIFSMFAGINLSVSAEDDVLNYLTWEITDGEVTITGCDTSISGDVVIPDTIEGYPVTTIEFRAFEDCDSLISIKIPAGVTFIKLGDSWGFSPHINLESITVDPENQYYSSEDGVLFNKDKTSLLFYPTGSNRTEYVVPDGVKSIENCAFFRGNALKKILIPASVTSITKNDEFTCGFVYCSNLENITVAPENQYYSSEDGVLFNKDKTILIQYPASNSRTEYVVPNSVKRIEDCAFYGSILKNILIPDSVKYLGFSAFAGCINIEEVIIPDSVTSTIGEGAFAYCVNLKNVTIGNGVTGIEDSAFLNCPNLKNVIIGKNVTFIGDQAFLSEFGNKEIESITIPENVEIVGRETFTMCSALDKIYICNPELIIGKNSFGTRFVIIDEEKYTNIVKDLYMNRYLLIFKGIENDGVEEKLVTELLNVIRELTEDENRVIYGHTGSTAEAYANENNLTFAEIGQIIPPVEEEPEVPEIPDVPETPEKPEENKPENDFFGIIRELFERIVNFFEKIFETLKSIFA